MTSADERELEWWRMFAMRFGPGARPRTFEPLAGNHLVVCVERPDGTLVPWSECDA